MHTLVVSPSTSDADKQPGSAACCTRWWTMTGRLMPPTKRPKRPSFQAPLELIAVVLAQDPERGWKCCAGCRGTRGCCWRWARHRLAAYPAGVWIPAPTITWPTTKLESGLDSVLSRVAGKDTAAARPGRFLAVLLGQRRLRRQHARGEHRHRPRQEHGQCGLVDLKPGRGDLPALLDLRPQFTLADICRNLARLDRGMFEKMVVRHSSGVHLLGVPPSFGDARAITPQGVMRGTDHGTAAVPASRRRPGRLLP